MVMMKHLPYDVARCVGMKCALRTNCLRAMTIISDPPDAWTTYIHVFPQPKTSEDVCEHQIPTEST